MSVTNDYIAEHVGVNKSTIPWRVKGEAKVMKLAVIEKLSYLPGIDVKSLLKNPNRFEKPLLGIAKAGYGLFAEENLAGHEEVSKNNYYRDNYFPRICDDSATGAHVHDQDLIYVKRCDDVKSGTIAVILTGSTEATVKRTIKKRPFLILEATNPAVPARYFMQREVGDLPVGIIGKVLCNRSDTA